MATSSEQNDPGEKSSVINCPICLDKMRLPRRLPCLHTFCDACIQSYVLKSARKSAVGEEDENLFRCPICRMEVTLPNVSPTEWAERLPIDHLMMRLNESESTDSATQISKEIYCDPCKYASEKNEAKFHCRDCKECFCEQCLAYFHKRKRDHNTHTVTEITENTPLEPLEVDEMCPVHVDKVLEVYCFDHRSLCCSVCFATNHRKCDVVKSLDEMANDEEEDNDYDEFVAKLVDAEQRAEKMTKDKRDNITQLSVDKEEILQSVANNLAEIKLHLDTLHDEFKNSTEKTFSSAEQNLEFDIECALGFQKTLAGCKRLTEAVRTHGSRKQLFITMEKSRLSIKKHFSRLESAINFPNSDNRYTVDTEDAFDEVQKWSKLATLNMQSEKNSLIHVESALCQLGYLNDHNIFQHKFPVNNHFPQYSPLFHFRGALWRVECSREKTNNLGIFLRCLGDVVKGQSDWSFNMPAELRIVNSTDRMNDNVKSIKNTFSKSKASWGYNPFINWSLLLSTDSGFVSNGSGCMEIRVKFT